jgi:hypothetical protein
MEARRVSSDCRTSLFGEVDRDPTPMSSRYKVVSSNPVHGEVYLIQHYVIKFVSDRSVVFSGYSGFLMTATI